MKGFIETVCTLMMAIQVGNTRNARSRMKREDEEGMKTRVELILEGMGHIKCEN